MSGNEPVRRHQRLFLQAVEGQVLSQEPACPANAPFLRRVFPLGGDQQHIQRHAQASVMEQWAKAVGGDFKFTLKADRRSRT